MTDATPDQILARAQSPAANGRPVRKDEIELHDRGSTSSRGCPSVGRAASRCLFVHGELAGSWLWERYLGYFAARGWEGHALNLRNHYWSQTADPATLSFDTYTEDVVAVDRALRLGRRWSSATGWAACWRSRRPSGCRWPGWSSRPRSCRVELRDAGPVARAPRDPRGLRQEPDRLGDAPRAPVARRSRPDPGRRPAHPAPARAEAARGGCRASPDARRRPGRSPRGARYAAARHRGGSRSDGQPRRLGAARGLARCRRTSRSRRTPTTGS